jgi:hypothetical protein
MNIILPVGPMDLALAVRLLKWCAILGRQAADLYVLLDRGMPTTGWNPNGFAKMTLVEHEPRVDGPAAAVVSHHQLARQLVPDAPYLMLEPDCVPLRKDWLAAILRGHGGDMVNTVSGTWVKGTADCPQPFLNGVALYPAKYEVLPMAPGVIGSDRSNRRVCHPNLHFRTNRAMLHVYWDETEPPFPIKDCAPTFPDQAAVDLIAKHWPEAALFHRCKDGTLIDRLLGKPPEGSLAPTHRDEFPRMFTSMGLLGKGLELGVDVALYSKTILEGWPGEMLFLVDDWMWEMRGADGPTRKAETLERLAPFAGRFTIITDRSPGCASQFANGSLDWIYIDAHHGYHEVIADLHAWYPKVKVGGVIAGHDYMDAEGHGAWRHTAAECPQKPLSEVNVENLPEFGVRSGVNAFRRQLNLKDDLTATPEWPPSFYWVKSPVDL